MACQFVATVLALQALGAEQLARASFPFFFPPPLGGGARLGAGLGISAVSQIGGFGLVTAPYLWIKL